MPRRSERVAFRVAANVALAGMWAALAWAHVDLGRRTGRWASVFPIVAEEALLVALFLVRRPSTETSTRGRDWAAGVAGVVLPLLLRPSDPEGRLAWLGWPVQLAGLALAIVGTAFLGRRIGIVAAHRGLQTTGAYARVRHPIYGAYAVCYLGYVACFPSLRNVLLTAATLVAFHLRAAGEERLLARDPAYRRYRDRVRWRYVPFVW